MTDTRKATKSEKARQRAERAAAAAAEAKRRERRRNVLTGVVVVVVMALLVGGGVLLGLNSDDSEEVADRVAAAEVDASDVNLVVGPEDAPHEVIIYEDFLCPICGIVESRAGERLTALAEQGQVQVEYRPISILGRFGPYSDDALNAFFVVQQASGDEVAKTFHDLLFAQQPAESGPFLDTAALVDLAVQAGAEESAVRDGILGGAEQDRVQQATEQAAELGVEGTPTIVLDGQPFSQGSSWEQIADNLVAAVQD